MDDRRQRHPCALISPQALRARQHQQVGAVAAHPGGKVVEAEKAVEPFGILLVALQPVDQRELLVDQ